MQSQKKSNKREKEEITFFATDSRRVFDYIRDILYIHKVCFILVCRHPGAPHYPRGSTVLTAPGLAYSSASVILHLATLQRSLSLFFGFVLIFLDFFFLFSHWIHRKNMVLIFIGT